MKKVALLLALVQICLQLFSQEEPTSRRRNLESEYMPAVYTAIKSPSTHRDSLYNMLLNSDYSFFEEPFEMFDTIQVLFENSKMDAADSLMYANSLYNMAGYSWNKVKSTFDDEQSLMIARTKRYLKLADAACSSPQNAETENYADILFMLTFVNENLQPGSEVAIQYAKSSLAIFKSLPPNEYRDNRISLIESKFISNIEIQGPVGSYMSHSDYMNIAVDDDEVMLLYNGYFKPTKATHCDSLRYDIVCALIKSQVDNPSERINNTRSLMIDFRNYIESGVATGNDSLYFAYSLYNVGRYVREASYESKALDYLLEAKTIFEKLKQNITRNYANTLYEIAEYYSHSKKYEMAVDYYKSACGIYGNCNDSFYNHRCNEIYGDLFQYYKKSGDYYSAIGVCDDYIEWTKKTFEDPDEAIDYYAETFVTKADLYSEIPDYPKAIESCEKYFSLVKNDENKRASYLYQRCLCLISDAYEAVGDVKTAKKYRKQYEKLAKDNKLEDDVMLDFGSEDIMIDTGSDFLEEYEPMPMSHIDSVYMSLSRIAEYISGSEVLEAEYKDMAESNFNELKQVYDSAGLLTDNDSLVFAYSHLNVALVEMAYEDYKAALGYLDKLEPILPQDATLRFNYMQYRLNIYEKLGEYSTMLRICEQMHEYFEKNAISFEYAFGSFLKAANMYASFNDYDKAFGYYNELLDVCERDGYPLYGYLTIHSMATTYCKIGDYISAIHCVLPYLENTDCGYIDSDLYVELCNVLGNAYLQLGNFEKSAFYLNMAQECARASYEEESPETANTLHALGNLYKKLGNYVVALDVYGDALKIYQAYYGENDQNCVDEFISIGNVYYAMGNYDKALASYEKCLSIMSANNAQDNGEYALLLANVANAYNAMGDSRKALTYFDEAMPMMERIYGSDHTIYAEGLNYKGDVLFAAGDFLTAAECYSEALSINRTKIVSDFSFLTASEREIYWKNSGSTCQKILRCGSKLPENEVVACGAYDAELITKGLLLTSDIEFTKTIFNSGDSVLISDYMKLVDMNDRLNKAYAMPVEERYIDCRKLKAEINAAESDLVSRAARYGNLAGSIALTWKDVQSSMKQGEVAVEFTKYDVDSTESRYAALVLTKDMKSPALVPLCTAKDLQKLLRTGSLPVKQTEEDRGATVLRDKRMGVYVSTDLYNVLWKPLEKYFGKDSRVYFAPAGMLHQIAIEYAPVNPETTISDKYEIYRVSSTRLLAMDSKTRELHEAVLYGGIKYDTDTTSMKRENERFGARSISYNSFAEINSGEDRASLNYLPGTKTEVEIIGAKLKSGNVDVDMRMGDMASEESFKSLSGKNFSVLHIATHGFYMPVDDKLTPSQTLNLSGLMFSGANNIWQNKSIPEGVEDGVLTAKEISGMDLRGTDMVVLSACQTGLGEITDEGVFGLQRGFKKAGANTIIMSLWSVDDNATQLMMTEFYANLISGMSKRDAFLKAQNKVKTTAGFENPRFWAAFIMLDGMSR